MRRRSEPEVAPRSWMLTFSDLLTLLLIFFVLRLSMTSVDLQHVVDYLKTAEPGGKQSEITNNIRQALVSVLGEPISQTETSYQFEDGVVLQDWEDGSIILLRGSTFAPGSDRLASNVKKAVENVSEAIRAHASHIKVTGHTDNTPISSLRFPSNWELSAARAVSTAEELIQHGISAAAISAVGYADRKPVDSNDTSQGREQNRRVEIYVRAK